MILVAPALGSWVDRAPSRLRTLLTAITANRLAVISSCVFWLFIVGDGANAGSGNGSANESEEPDPDTEAAPAARSR